MTIYTTGCQFLTVKQLLNLITENGIEFICDVRLEVNKDPLHDCSPDAIYRATTKKYIKYYNLRPLDFISENTENDKIVLQIIRGAEKGTLLLLGWEADPIFCVRFLYHSQKIAAKTLGKIEIAHILDDKIISQKEITEKMLQYYFKKMKLKTTSLPNRDFLLKQTYNLLLREKINSIEP